MYDVKSISHSLHVYIACSDWSIIASASPLVTSDALIDTIPLSLVLLVRLRSRSNDLGIVTGQMSIGSMLIVCESTKQSCFLNHITFIVSIEIG